MAPTGLLAYLKLLYKAKYIRFQYSINYLLRVITGKAPARLTPNQSFTVPSTKSRRGVKVNIYRTKAALNHTGPVAVHLTWHGSGFVFKSFGENGVFIKYLLDHPILSSYPLAILDCDYAKGPEYVCPAATDDARDVLEYVFMHPEVYDISRVTLGGFSAGGAISLGLSVTIGKEVRTGTWSHPTTGHPIKTVVAFYPVAKWWETPIAPRETAGLRQWLGGMFPKDLESIFRNSYFFTPKLNHPKTSEEDDRRVIALMRQPLHSPGYGETKDFPDDIVIYTCENDHLTREAENLRQKLQAGGKRVYGELVMGVYHSWDLEVRPGDVGYVERQKAYDVSAKAIARAGGVQVDI
ncbi:SubName: Full=Related to similarity to carboxylic ester hydrolases-Aspergillus niger {ECO:0000313/EMBL:CCA71315.1}; {ECO:0000313/EMBL:CCA71315.1}; {ECO:0000313/EMBL:CCA71315.1} [Serendipita indica DSM 11827]|nr:SubName: Full=Related to similarity to carboxylic ester hydrolases-Aspergillus niger {ECO:0000313/EMBL:CCA71315.1}; {ECO:0000313/EMBL:CCA71315.1}; {ECO:0000313/EMBL:CCA71315.1} [Serendipita indica DSM 11827]